jgi:N-methylhydantoinase A/oxoprolinase/acetone carboxylase beta subunit
MPQAALTQLDWIGVDIDGAFSELVAKSENLQELTAFDETGTPAALAMLKPYVVGAGVGWVEERAVKTAEATMAAEIDALIRGKGDPRRLTLVSFGRAGGLHVCNIAGILEIPTALILPMGNWIAESSKTVIDLGEELDDARLAAEFGQISGQTMEKISYERTAETQAWADVRCQGQLEELRVRVMRPSWEDISASFLAAYESIHGQAPTSEPLEIIALIVKRIGKLSETVPPDSRGAGDPGVKELKRDELDAGDSARASQVPVLTRDQVLKQGPAEGPLRLMDGGIMAYIPTGWRATVRQNGAVIAMGLN